MDIAKRKAIEEHLCDLEAEKHIRILYAVESGSRAWGFASKDSDWDVRLLYVHNPDWYLSIDDKKDSLERMFPAEVDVAGWELRKALRLFRKSNPPMLEWLRSPIIYREETLFASRLRDIVTRYFNPKSCLYHYLNMASRNFEAYFKGEEVRLKKYFYILRPLMACSWIKRTMTMAPMEFQPLWDAEDMKPETRKDVAALLQRKILGDELSKEARIPSIDEYIESRFVEMRAFLNSDFQVETGPEITLLDSIFRTALEEAWH